jgi:hypothetical protein
MKAAKKAQEEEIKAIKAKYITNGRWNSKSWSSTLGD